MKISFAPVLAAFLIIAPAIPARAAIVSAPGLSIAHVISFDHNIGIVFQFSGGTVSGCADGAWMPTDSPGFRNLYISLMAAKVTGNTVTLSLDNDPTKMWPGGGTFCRVSNIMME